MSPYHSNNWEMCVLKISITEDLLKMNDKETWLIQLAEL